MLKQNLSACKTNSLFIHQNIIITGIENSDNINMQLENHHAEMIDTNAYIELEKKQKISAVDYEGKSVFLFVNPSSGGNKAKVLTDLNTECLRFSNDFIQSTCIPDTKKLELYIFNLKNPDSLAKGMQCVRVLSEHRVNEIRIVVGGGDGTVMWVVEELVKAKINLDYCAIGVLPFGTGNDFSRSTGWGGGEDPRITKSAILVLKELMRAWLRADVKNFDVWDSDLYMHETGEMKKVQKNKKKFEKVPLKDGDGKTILHYQKTFTNYLSFGVDARIGFGFDKKRTNSRFWNKCIYCCEGIKKMFLKTNKIPKVIKKLESQYSEVSDKNNAAEAELENVEVILRNQNEKSSKVLVFKSPDQIKQKGAHEESDHNQNLLKGSPVTLIALNIPSYSGGVKDVWKNAKKSALKSVPRFEVEENKVHQVQNQVLSNKCEQNFGDGLIEFITFPSISSMGRERMFPGNASRVCQGPGEYTITFKEGHKQLCTYFQVDGEYYKVVNPKELKIKKSVKIPHGRIKVLVKKNP